MSIAYKTHPNILISYAYIACTFQTISSGILSFRTHFSATKCIVLCITLHLCRTVFQIFFFLYVTLQYTTLYPQLITFKPVLRSRFVFGRVQAPGVKVAFKHFFPPTSQKKPLSTVLLNFFIFELTWKSGKKSFVSCF